MIHASIAAPNTAPPKRDNQELEPLDPLLRFAGEVANPRALVIAGHNLDLICGLLRRGCLTASVIRPGAKPDADDYDLIFIPPAAAFPFPHDVILLAHRSLAPFGRLTIGVTPGSTAGGLVRRLRLNGFHAVRTARLLDVTLLRADRRRPS